MIVRRAREQMGLSQDDFANALSQSLGRTVSQSQISDWERGRFEPGASVLLAVAELSDRSVDELRGAARGPIIERLERLQDEVDRVAQGSDDHQVLHREMAERIQQLEKETQRMGSLLAKVIEDLDREEVLQADEGPSDLPARERAEDVG